MKSVTDYLALRRAMGFELEVQGRLLRNFARFATDRSETHVRRQTAVEWAALAPSPEQRDHRLKQVLRFAQHARAEDRTHEILPDGVFGGTRRRPLPFIYSPQALSDLIAAAARLGPPHSLRPHTYATLFGLLASTGLRISEALALRLDDVTSDGLVVRQSKFRKSRLVPLHETTAAALDRYRERRRKIAGAQGRLFVSLGGRALAYRTVSSTFLALVRGIGLHPGRGKRGPRIHDLRHTFAVRALEASSHDRTHIDRHILALSTYLGHAHVADTFWYLEATPDLLRGVADVCERFLEGGAR